jgi:hypothetical protein
MVDRTTEAFMASGYYVVLALAAVALLGTLIWPFTARRPQPARIVPDRSRRRRVDDRIP